jgi:mutator protein MutT
MKQRISVRAIVRDESKILLLKRSAGRETILGKFELPGGKVVYGEQPEDALRRILHDEAGIHIQTFQLYDAVTYIDHDDRDVQFLVLVYIVALAPGHHGITLSDNYNKYVWQSMQKTQQNEITDLTTLLLGIFQQQAITSAVSSETIDNDAKGTAGLHATLFTDGGSRGNPGPSAGGYVIYAADGTQVDEGGEYIGITTNNIAEYQGLLLGLTRVAALGYSSVECKIDSMLVVNQMNGIYKIKNRELWPVHERIRSLTQQFRRVVFTHVTRDKNQSADRMVNITLDKQQEEYEKNNKTVA